ncbi:hypothetical protein D915_001391 [Fasciola hepatica]|uniref:TATA-binding protein-associated factor n=1 Tax=Fasciola hepatica TaxID=6192 RepID=A0A4E0RYT4_FASHE|nr:hypothetical protein D915_001391 [Fasciola hepatica]
MPLLRSRNWISRVAAADVIRSIVRHLPDWTPPVGGPSADAHVPDTLHTCDGFLSLEDLRLDRVLAQGARLYSMDVRELERPATRRLNSALEYRDNLEATKENGPPSSPLAVQRQELNKRLGLEDDNVVSSVLATHANVSLNHWIGSDDLEDQITPGTTGSSICQMDVATCVKTAYNSEDLKSGKRSAPVSPDESNADGRLPKQARSDLATSDEESLSSCTTWPLDRMCTNLLGDLWALRWETRHGAASGLRELLSEPRHTWQAGKCAGMSEEEMTLSNLRYLEDILVRVLCTLALDQLSDFVSDEVVAPVRETAAQLLGVLSRHLSADRVLLVTRHLIYLTSLKEANQGDQSADPSCGTMPVVWKNSWMIVHGGLLGIKYLLASRKDLRSVLLPLVTPCLVDQLEGTGSSGVGSNRPNDQKGTTHSVADEDIRAAAASALIPVVDADWLLTLNNVSRAYQLIDHIWHLLRESTTDLSPSTGPLLQLICALTTAQTDTTELMSQSCSSTSVEEAAVVENGTSVDPTALSNLPDLNRMHFQLDVLARLIHHVSSGIRSNALLTLQCLLNTWNRRHVQLSAELLQLIIDQLFHRILLETTTSVRSLATRLCIDVIQSADLKLCTRACVDRLDFWLCQAMQPIGVPFPPHLFSALVPVNPCALLVQPERVVLPVGNVPTDEIVTDSHMGTGALDADPAPIVHEHGYCIGGSHSVVNSPTQQEAFVWDTRMHAVRVLTHLFSRICQCVEIDTPSTKLAPSDDSTASETVTPSMCLLTFFLDQLLCCLHLNERLAMQRFIGGLVLSSWALLPAGPKADSTWATVLENLPPLLSNSSGSQDLTTATTTNLPGKLRQRLEACLTEVIYYEEILGLFKLMQEDCRELVRMLQSLGLDEDPVFVFNGVRTIAQCLVMLDKASKQLDDCPGVSNGTIDPEAYRTAVYKLDRARSTVERCLALQLHWGSRVEFAIASALTNLNCLLPGRLSLLIRPFMDTIRCICPTPSAAELQSSKNLELLLTTQMLPTGSNLTLQRLATVCLARLLQLEWALHARKQSTGASNPSKAAVKVVKNLAASLLESDPQLHSIIDQNEGKSISKLSSESESPVSDERDCINRLPKVLSGTDLLLTANDSRNPWLEARFHGSALALGYLCQTFLQPNNLIVQSMGDPGASPYAVEPLRHLQLGLPGLWTLMWTEPVRRIFALGDTLGVERRDSSLRSFLQGDLINQITGLQVQKSDEEAICTGVLTLTTCVPALLPHLHSVTEPASSGEQLSMTFDELIYLGVVTTCLQSAIIRALGAKLLASLAIEKPVETLNLLLPLYLVYLEPFEMSNNSLTSITGDLKRENPGNTSSSTPSACTGTLEALTAIVEQLNQASFPDGGSQRAPWFGLDQNDPLADPELCDCRSGDVVDTADGATVSGELKLHRFLTLFLPYIVVLVPPVLRLLADPNSTVRILASRLFTSLLTLFPLEGSLSDPPGMDPDLRVARATKRQFIDSLLHPDRIQMYNLPVPIQANLRGYQQDGVNWLSFLNRYGLNGILCDDLGLGKTLQTLCILAGSHYELRQKQNSGTIHAGCARSLVICPSTLCGHWLHEVEQFVSPRDLSPIVYSGGPGVRFNLQTQILDHNLVIASYDLVRNDISFFQSVFWNYVVLDEGHIIKSSKSKIARALKQLCARHRLILTGTPIQNRVCELWSLFDFLMPDFLGSESSFVARFCRPVAASRDPKATRAEQRAGHLALENLHRLVLPFMLRRLKEDVMRDLPPKIIQDFACEMTSIQLMLYETFMKSNEGRVLLKSINVKREDGDDAESLPVTYGAVRHGFQALRYLQAVCNHPCLALKPTHPILADVKRVLQTEYGTRVSLDSVHLSGKLLALCRLLTDCGFGTPNFGSTADLANQFCSSGTSSAGSAPDDLDDSSRGLLNQHRALIFFQTREMLRLTEDMLKNQFPWLTSTRLDGSVPLNERYARVTRFNSDPSIDLMLLTTAVGGLGLNLTGADTVIFVEHDWNPSKDLQAMDRVHRIGQRRTVNVYRLITQDSIEEQIMNLQAFKLHLANTVVSADNRHLNAMDTGHLFDRFTAAGQQSSSNQQDHRPSGSDSGAFESLEECYETEYNLDAFVARLK